MRFQWYGLYQDKPKVGYFMLRIKAPSGIMTAAAVPRHGRAVDEVRARLHRAVDAPERPAALAADQAVPRSLRGARRRRPDVARAAAATASATSPAARSPASTPTSCSTAGRARRGRAATSQTDRDYFDLPRKHKITISTCAAQCNAPEINCIVFIGTRQDGRDGFFAARRRRAVVDAAPRARPGRLRPAGRGAGGRQSDPGRLAHRPALPPLAGQGAAEVPGRRLRRRGRPRRPSKSSSAASSKPLRTCRRRSARADHLGVASAEASRPGLHRLPGLPGPRHRRADHPDRRPGRGVRRRHPPRPPAELHHHQRARERASTRSSSASPRSASRSTSNGIRGASVGCTGQPLCNFAVAETKSKLKEIVLRLEDRFGSDVEGLKIGVDGCPHACAHHWVTDIGLQGTTARGDEPARQAGGVRDLSARRPRRARRDRPAAAAARADRRGRGRTSSGWSRAYLSERQTASRSRRSRSRKSDEELISIGTGEPLRRRGLEARSRSA